MQADTTPERTVFDPHQPDFHSFSISKRLSDADYFLTEANI
jgi:hypothetical protein